VARDIDLPDFLLGLARRRNRPARRLAATKLSEVFDDFFAREAAAERAQADAQPWSRSESALRLAARQKTRARRVSVLLLRGHVRGMATLRGLRAAAAGLWVGLRVSVDAAARSLWKGVFRRRRRAEDEPGAAALA